MTIRGDLVPLSDDTLAGLESACTRVDFHTGDCLFQVGAAADQAFVLLEGRVAILGAAPGESVQIDMIDTPGRLFGWEPLVLDSPARLTGATVESDGCALRLDLAALGRDDAQTAEGRLSGRYLRRAARQAFDGYLTGINAG